MYLKDQMAGAAVVTAVMPVWEVMVVPEDMEEMLEDTIQTLVEPGKVAAEVVVVELHKAGVTATQLGATKEVVEMVGVTHSNLVSLMGIL